MTGILSKRECVCVWCIGSELMWDSILLYEEKELVVDTHVGSAVWGIVDSEGDYACAVCFTTGEAC